MNNPRLHPRVSAVDGSRLIYACGCINEILPPHNVLRSVSKCRKHLAGQRDPATLDEAYYRELGVLTANGKLAETNHVAELTEALGEFPRAPHPLSIALEIGCGASPYFEAIAHAGYVYAGCEPSCWAADWMRRMYGAKILDGDFDGIDAESHAGEAAFILAAHSIEHMPDAPGAIAKCSRLLAPGGELWIVVPDDSDPVNPDHLFTFSAAALRSCVEAAGLVVERLETRRYVAHEQFLYCRARKPA